jgi:hypothetical protein
VTQERLRNLLAAELAQPAPEGAQAVARELARRGGDATAAVLYYGSALRAGTLDGVLDFYVLLDDVRAWPGSWLVHLANRLLPPNVGYLEFDHGGERLRAKFAVMTVTQFARRVTATALDTTLWARFCQPALIVWSRTAADHATAVDLVAAATVRAADWAARLGPATAPAAEFWRGLFARTYTAELRVEKTSRAADIVGRDPARYTQLLPLAWEAGGIPHAHAADDALETRLSDAQRARAAAQWSRRARLGKPLNIVRLLKAAFTFEGAMDYVAWKIERHSGVRIEVAPWQRRFPLLAAPGLYWKLRRRGVLR